MVVSKIYQDIQQIMKLKFIEARYIYRLFSNAQYTGLSIFLLVSRATLQVLSC